MSGLLATSPLCSEKHRAIWDSCRAKARVRLAGRALADADEPAAAAAAVPAGRASVRIAVSGELGTSSLGDEDVGDATEVPTGRVSTPMAATEPSTNSTGGGARSA